MKIWEYKSDKDDKLSKELEKDNTIVMTKPSMALHLINRVEFRNGDVVMEPCKGTGSFYNNLPENVEKRYCEINEGIDYLKNEEMVDITLSNPPFVPRKLFWEFMRVAMRTTRREIYWLINMQCLNVFTPNRLDELKENKWYINDFHIVNDKRWYGRYVWVRISKTDSGTITYCKTSF